MGRINMSLSRFALIIACGVIFTAQVVTAEQPVMQNEAHRQQRDNSKKSANAGTSMAVVHGAAALVCAASCAAIWTGGWAEVACTASSLGAGITELVMTDNIAKAGASGAMAVIGAMGGAATTSGLVGLVPMLKMGSTAANAAGKTAGKAGARNSAQKISCLSTVVEAAQAVISGMGANDAKKSEKAAQERMDLLANSGSNPAVSTQPGLEENKSQSQLQHGNISQGTSQQLPLNDTPQDMANMGDINNSQGENANTTDACGSIQTFQHAVRCAMASNPKLPQSLADPGLEDEFKKLIGTDPLSFFKDKDMAQALGAGASGSGADFSVDTLKEVAKALDDSHKGLEGVGVAGGGGGGGKGGSGEPGNDLASLFANKEEGTGGPAAFERKQYGDAGAARNLATSDDDPRVSIFLRITRRYQVVTKRWLNTPADSDSSDPSRKL